MESLFAHALAAESYTCRLPSGRGVALRQLRLRFGRASPEYLRHGALPASYTSKPLVTFNGDAMFGELAVVRWLEVDGWSAAWLDTLHGRKVWQAMPTKAVPVRLPLAQQALYDRIVLANNGRASGTFDVMAWRDGQTIFLEYQGPHEPPHRKHGQWIEAAIAAGVSVHDLFVVSAT